MVVSGLEVVVTLDEKSHGMSNKSLCTTYDAAKIVRILKALQLMCLGYGNHELSTRCCAEGVCIMYFITSW